MAQVKGKDFEPLGGRVPKTLADRLKKHADELSISYTEVYVMALQRYMDSPEARIAVLQAQVRRLKSLESQVGPRTNYRESIEDRLGELEERRIDALRRAAGMRSHESS